MKDCVLKHRRGNSSRFQHGDIFSRKANKNALRNILVSLKYNMILEKYETQMARSHPKKESLKISRHSNRTEVSGKWFIWKSHQKIMHFPILSRTATVFTSQYAVQLVNLHHLLFSYSTISAFGNSAFCYYEGGETQLIY